MKPAVAWAVAAIFSTTLPAADIHDLYRSCFQRAGLGSQIHWTEQCANDIFTLTPVHPAIQSIAPITGTGVGVGIDRKRNLGNFEFLPSAKLVVSTNRSVLADARLTVGLPRPPGLGAAGKPAVTVYAQRVEMQEQHYYGPGQIPTQSGLALYRERWKAAGVSIGASPAQQVSVALSVDFLQPKILSVFGKTRPDMTQLYDDASAPGLSQQPGFVKVEPSLALRFLPLRLDFVEFKTGYAFFHDRDTGRYSFRRFRASGEMQFPILVPTQNTAANRSGLSKFLCAPMPAGECSLGEISLSGQVIVSQTDTGNEVPFYLQPTLGGADISGEDTLRGYRDYRFRGPNRMFFHAEFRHHLWQSIGGLLFYDVGRVASRPSDLGFDGLRHSIGVGAYLTAGNLMILRVSVGFGTGEGLLPKFRLPGGF